MKICITAGGTGGHIYPALALADELSGRGHDIIYIGHDEKMEATIVPKTGYPFYGIKNSGLTPGILNKIKAVASQFGAVKAAKKILKDQQVDLVVSFGGYVTFPVCQAANQLNIQYIIHEQNAFAGKANKMLEKKASAIVICYEHARQFFTNPNTHLLGNPRSSMIHQSLLDSNILEKLDLKKEDPILYFVMGSLGSETVAKILCEMINDNDFGDTQIVISTGVNNYEIYEQNLNKEVSLHQQLDQVSLLPHVDLTVSRAGATAVAELMAFGVPSILIPSPYVANNHQYFNAKAVVDEKAALMIEEKDLSAAKLYRMISDLLKNESLRLQMKENTQSLAFLNASEQIANLVEKVNNE